MHTVPSVRSTIILAYIPVVPVVHIDTLIRFLFRSFRCFDDRMHSLIAPRQHRTRNSYVLMLACLPDRPSQELPLYVGD